MRQLRPIGCVSSTRNRADQLGRGPEGAAASVIKQLAPSALLAERLLDRLNKNAFSKQWLSQK